MIHFEKLRLGYGSRILIDDLSATIEGGTLTALVGRNGTGKSTLLYLLTGLLRPQQGSVLYKGEDVQKRLPSTLSDMFIVPEEFELPKMSIKRYAALHAGFYPRFSYEQLQKNLAMFGLDDSVVFNNLSMGQRKKAYLAFALACNVELLLLDEPTNGLDITAKGALRSILASYADGGKSIIISTHQAHDIENLIDRVVIIDSGEILLNQSVYTLQQCFGFGVVENHQAIYSTQSIAGKVGIWAADNEEEGRFDLELLFNAAIKAKSDVLAVIASKTE